MVAAFVREKVREPEKWLIVQKERENLKLSGNTGILSKDLTVFTLKQLSNYKSYAIMALNLGAILGYLAFGPLADRLGRKKTFLIFFLGSLLLAPSIFYNVTNYTTLLLLLPVLGFFNSGIFSGFPIYLAELYPTRLRATGQGFCFNFGRILAATGPLLTGFLVSSLGSCAKAVTAVSMIYIVGIITLYWARETKGNPLPD